MKRLAIAAMLVWATPCLADNWTGSSKIALIEPLIDWGGGGMVRIHLNGASNTLCGPNSTVFDLVFSVGTQESRSAALSAIYMALAADKPVKIFFRDNSCSAGGAPLVIGAAVAP